MKVRLAAGATILALSVLAASGVQAASVEDGRRIAERNCGMCHAIGPTGQSRNPKAPPFRTLGKRYPLEMLQEALAEGMLTGHDMPEFRFTTNEIDSLIAYLKSVQDHAQAKASHPALAWATRQGL
jgi:mono/diheme cytochrome c family protein